MLGLEPVQGAFERFGSFENPLFHVAIKIGVLDGNGRLSAKQANDFQSRQREQAGAGSVLQMEDPDDAFLQQDRGHQQ